VRKEVVDTLLFFEMTMELIECREKSAKDDGQRTELTSITGRPGDAKK
jgi:hypothetical protein